MSQKDEQRLNCQELPEKIMGVYPELCFHSKKADNVYGLSS
jgi:hypothetical protein